MSALRKAVAASWRCATCAALAVACTVCAAKPRKPAPDPWQAAVEARSTFEAQPSHTREQYTELMDLFRAIYHSNPADLHAAASVSQVAELLAEQGHELHDDRSLHASTGQYAFLVKAYPSSSWAAKAHSAHLDSDQHPRPEPAAEAPPDAAPAREDVSTATPPKPGRRATISGIRHWSTPSYTRVAIDLGDEVQYQAARVEHPDRIYFDLHHTRLVPELVGKSFTVTDDGFLTRIRAAQYSDDVTRVVLDVHEVTEYSAFLLPNPYRLIIDIHGKPSGNATQTASTEVAAPSPVAAEPPANKHPDPPSSRHTTETAVSHLPPMPVTDGSSTFGLPPRSDKPTISAPRVVIPEKSTPARPVPNTVASRSASTGTDVAAVSEQPGKVEATPHPTSAPVVARSRTGRKSTPRDTPPPPIKGEPTLPPPPTADGETSLLRALGLKIGRIVIDAGHGGHDSGTLGADGIQEKDIVLDVALRLGKLLHQRLGSEVVYTRADDTFIPLETRTAIANKAQADLFISVHANSSPDASARGVEVYYLNFTSDPEAMSVASRENAVSTQSVHQLSDLVKKIALKDKIEESRELAGDVETSLYSGLRRGNEGLKDRGVKKAPFVVLIGANMPSILAEISFVTNPTDAAELRTAEYRERVAESLFAGVARYAGAVNGVKSVGVQRASGR